MAGIPKRLPLFKPAVCFLQFSMSEPRPSCYLPCPLSVLVCNLSSSDKGRTELPTHRHGIFHFSVVFEMWFKYGLSTKQEVDQVTSQRSFLSCESVILLEWLPWLKNSMHTVVGPAVRPSQDTEPPEGMPCLYFFESGTGSWTDFAEDLFQEPRVQTTSYFIYKIC